MFRRLPHASPTPRVLVLLLGPMLLGASCGSQSGTESPGGEETPARPSGPQVEELEQVDLGELSRAERRVWVELINERLSPCDEPISVGRCVAEERSCRRCVPAARYLVRLITEGYERQEIESHYENRYGQGAGLEIDVEGAPSRGSPMAAVTIVEFSDFECPYCGRAHPVLQQILDDFEGRVRLVFRHYPLGRHPHAMPAARAAVAAGDQGHFWEMHDMLFEHQRQLEEEDLMGYAREIGLDMDAFSAALVAPETQARVEADMAAGGRLGVEGTPSLYINGRRFDESTTSLAAYIREELDQ